MSSAGVVVEVGMRLTKVDPAVIMRADERLRFATDCATLDSTFEACIGAGGCFCGPFWGVARRFGGDVWLVVADELG